MSTTSSSVLSMVMTGGALSTLRQDVGLPEADRWPELRAGVGHLVYQLLGGPPRCVMLKQRRLQTADPV